MGMNRPASNGYNNTPYTGYSYNSQYTPQYGGTPQKTGTPIGSGYQTPSWGNNQSALTGYGTSDYQGPPGQGPPSNPGNSWDNYPDQGGQQQQPNTQYPGPQADYQNPDGTWHINPQYGQDNNGNGGQQQPQQGAGGGLGRNLYPGEPGYGDPATGPGMDRNLYPGEPGYVAPGPPTSGEGPGVPGSTPPATGGRTDWGLTWPEYNALPPDQKAAYDQYIATYVPGNQYQTNKQQEAAKFAEDTRRYNEQTQSGLIQQGFNNDITQRQLAEAITQGDWSRHMGDLNYGLESQGLQHQISQDQFGNTIATGRLGNETNLTNAQVAQIKAQTGIDIGKLANETNMTTAQIANMLFEQGISTGKLGNETKLTAAQIADMEGNRRIAERAQGLSETVGLGNLGNNTRMTTAQINDMAAKQGIDAGKLRNENKMTDAQIQDMLFQRGISTGKLGNETLLANAQAANWKGQLGLDTELGRGRLANETGMTQAQISDMRGRLGLDTELGRGRLANETGRLGLDTELGRGDQRLREKEINNRAYVDERSLNQNAQKLANDYGVSMEQIKATKWYQQQQVKIEQDRLAQTGQLGNRGLDVQEFTAHESAAEAIRRREQEAAIAREQMRSNEQMNLMSTFGRLQAPSARMIRNF